MNDMYSMHQQRYNTPNHRKRRFATTNAQTIIQRAEILSRLFPNDPPLSIAEICCGNCRKQAELYQKLLNLTVYRGMDVDPMVVTENRVHGISCAQGDALNAISMRQFLEYDVIFFGPPLSARCNGHQLIPFKYTNPGYIEFLSLMYGDLGYEGMIVCIGSKKMQMGDVRWLYEAVRKVSPSVNLPLIHHSHATITDSGEYTQPRLKYVETWFSLKLKDAWETKKSLPRLSDWT